VDERARFEHPAPEDRIRGPANHRIGDLLVVKNGPPATRAPHDVDSIAGAGLEVDVVERLHATEAEARRCKSIQTDRAGDVATSACVEQRQVATHVLLTGRGLVDDQPEPLSGDGSHALRH
jgi:hypothetical protein